MSLQPNNLNKFPKHLQHVRIQKEEEEDLWISGEELCTEGSSDEENTNDVKKKNKSKATPLKESLKAKKSSSSLTSTSTKESDDEFSESADIQKSPTNWRPKRGSIKLPNIEEICYNYCTYPSIEDDKWDTENEYGKALKQLKEYENQLKDFNPEIEYDNDVDFDENENNFEHSEQISAMETEIELMIKELQICTEQRKEYEKEVCDQLDLISKSTMELRSTQSFYEISKYNQSKSESNLISIKKIRKKVKQTWKRKPKIAPRVQRKMSELNISEEERIRLDHLLSDIEYDGTQKEIDDNNEINCHHQQRQLRLEDIINNDGAFNQTDDEKERLMELNQKLQTLQECDDADLKGNASEQDIIDEENREWKALLKFKDDKFRRIDEKINKLLAQDKEQSTEKENPMETSQETKINH